MTIVPRSSKKISPYYLEFLDPEGGSQKATLVLFLLLLLGISSLKILKTFLIRSGAQRNFAHTFVLTFPGNVSTNVCAKFRCFPHRSTVLDF